MKFLIKYTDSIEQRVLTYDTEEYSFDVEPTVKEINFDVVVNKINLTVIDDNKIVQVWGYSGYKGWIKSNDEVPKNRKGILKVIDNLEPGFSYRVSNEDLPVYVNIESGWVCIGNPKKLDNAVEFINNCVAVIDDDDEFVSLWLKPQSLPQGIG